MSVQKYEDYQKQVDSEVKKYRKEVKQIEESENPYYNSKAVKDYEIGLKRQELELKIHEINNNFQKDIESEIEVAQEEADRSKFKRFKASETVKREVDAYVNNLKSDLLLVVTEKTSLMLLNDLKKD